MKTPTAIDALQALKRNASASRAKNLLSFFKTGPGEYGEGDQFLGLDVPTTRSIAREFEGMPQAETLKLLKSPWHEARLLALMIFVRQYEKGTEAERVRIYRAYLGNAKWINNWDLVDLSSHEIVGAHLLKRSRAPLHRLAKSGSLWERRIAMVSTYAFIRERDFSETLAIAETLLKDDHDLIHKASGWMLREVGKRDEMVLKGFLDLHYKVMPRTMLRYSIERMSAVDKAHYMAKPTRG